MKKFTKNTGKTNYPKEVNFDVLENLKFRTLETLENDDENVPVGSADLLGVHLIEEED